MHWTGSCGYVLSFKLCSGLYRNFFFYIYMTHNLTNIVQYRIKYNSQRTAIRVHVVTPTKKKTLNIIRMRKIIRENIHGFDNGLIT